MRELITSKVVCSLIHPNRKQPRRHFDEAAMRDMTASMREHGLIQPILIRVVFDVPGKEYELIAGERRWRAFTAAFGADAAIPAIVLSVDDDVSAVLAAIENMQREQMGPAEEAEECERQLKKYGSREEVARHLCWPLSKIDRRLALMRCIPDVRVALNEKKIQLGHAELLAAAPADKQPKVLQAIILQKIPVSVVRQQLAQFSQKLDAAKFDKTECLQCPYNSSTQQSLFVETIAEGHCTHTECFQTKTTAMLESMKGELEESYQRVELLTSDSALNVVKLIAEGGKNAVGGEQAKACRGCANFGCTISNLIGSVGNVEHDLCFDAACNLVKAAEWHKESAKPAAKVNPDPKTSDTQPDAKSATTTKASTAHTGKSHVSKPRTVTVNKRVVEYRLKKWREMTAIAMTKDPLQARRVLVALSLSSLGREINSERFRKSYGRITGDTNIGSTFTDALDAVTANETHVERLIVTATATCAFNVQEQDLYALMHLFNVKVSDYWALNAEFLALMTKTEIEAVADEIGLKVLLEKDWLKLASSKKDDMIAALLKVENFPYNEALPSVMDWTLLARPQSRRTSNNTAKPAAAIPAQPTPAIVATPAEPSNQPSLELPGLAMTETAPAAPEESDFTLLEPDADMPFLPDMLEPAGFSSGDSAEIARLLDSTDVDQLVAITDFA